MLYNEFVNKPHPPKFTSGQTLLYELIPLKSMLFSLF